MQAREIVRTGLRLNYDKGHLTFNQPISMMGPTGPHDYYVHWNVTWQVDAKVKYLDKEYSIEGYDLAHDNHGGIWPDVVLKSEDGQVLRVDPVAHMNDNPVTWVHNLQTVENNNVELIETVEFEDTKDT